MEIKDRLRAARTRQGKTQARIAASAGMSVVQYNGYENGRSRPAPTTLSRLATALETTVDELLGKAEQKPSAPQHALTTPDGPSSVAEVLAWARSKISELTGMDDKAIKLDIRIET